ncbi:hypothetical protein SLS62_004735 [Diatrype stigma]|uniref:Dihydrolipoamide acetyltransferase component of pyruvate dehydrogenase complex n=1 Tax=Diatrype stigma TaxID=117547 RepID=A0AAN9YQ70_9PEZI
MAPSCIVECEIIQWFVEPEARVEEFSPLCEVQSDKASVEITSRFSGIVKKLHYEAGEMAKVGKPFVDIDIQGGVKQEDLDALTASESTPSPKDASEPLMNESLSKPPESSDLRSTESHGRTSGESKHQAQPPKGRFASLATPAVRHLSKELDVDIIDIQGTGKDGRVLKEDIYRFVEARKSPKQEQQPTLSPPPTSPSFTAMPPPAETDKQVETVVPLTNTQAQMFKTMTRSLSIPHFLYADEVDFSRLHDLRQRLNKMLSQQPAVFAGAATTTTDQQIMVSKLSYLPFVIKAVSMALYQYPILNARVDTDAADGNGNGIGNKPAALVHRSQHNVGVAMDTAAGLLVPVVRDVGRRSVLSVAAELVRLQSAAAAGRLSPQDLRGGTVTVSNIGSLGGTYVAPVVVDREVAILGLGRVRDVPAFSDDGEDRVVRRRVCNLSWSADHRVVDGATLARAAEVVRGFLEEPGTMVMHLR